jgi:hypothetical protein
MLQIIKGEQLDADLLQLALHYKFLYLMEKVCFNMLDEKSHKIEFGIKKSKAIGVHKSRPHQPSLR